MRLLTPTDLNDLGQRLDEAPAPAAARPSARRPPSWASPAVSRPNWSRRWWWAADWVGGSIGCCGHFGFHTSPVFLIVFFMLGAAAGIRNVMRAATRD